MDTGKSRYFTTSVKQKVGDNPRFDWILTQRRVFFFLIDPMKSLNEHNELQVLTQLRPNMFELCEVEIPKWFELSTNRQIGHQDMLHA